MKHIKKWLGLSLILVMGLLVLAGCQAKPNGTAKKINVVSSIDFYGDTAKAVLGKYGSSTSIINDDSADPHDFEPTARDAEIVTEADVVIDNGLGYDSWMSRLSTDSSAKKIAVAEDIMHKRDGDNEHVWYEPNTMKELAKQLAKTFGEIDKKHAKEYQVNANKYIASFKHLDTTIKKAKQKVNHGKVDVSEPVFDYALKNLGYQVNNRNFENAIDKEVDPTPNDLQSMQNDFKDHRVKMFIYNPQATNKIIDNLLVEAKQNHVPILKVTESMPKGENYLTWMQKQYDELIKIQNKK